MSVKFGKWYVMVRVGDFAFGYGAGQFDEWLREQFEQAQRDRPHRGI